jgi:endonuclease YncB( thermonuclease family)
MKDAIAVTVMFVATLAALVYGQPQIVESQSRSAPTITASTPVSPFQLKTLAMVKEVIDADTFDVEIKFTVRVREQELDAPESSTPEGQRAKQAMKKYAEGEKCVVSLNLPESEDQHIGGAHHWSYDRWIGRVSLKKAPKQTLGEWAVEQGYVKKKKL